MTKILIDEAIVKLALEALKQIDNAMPFPVAKLAQAALREALVEQPAQQEPVAYIHRQGNYYEVSERFLSDDEKSRGWTEEPLYTSPPVQRTWVGLTNAEVNNIAAGCHLGNSVQDAIYRAEAKLRSKTEEQT